MAGTLRFVLGDQLDRAALRDLEPARDVVLMAEVMAEATYVPHHPKKIAFVLAAMRHFADDLRQEGVRVHYVRLGDPGNTRSFRGELLRAAGELRPERVVATEPGEWRVLDDVQGWAEAAGVPVEVRADDRFFCSTEEFARWAGRRPQLRMELFYREMRQRTGILMAPDGAPEGRRWNFDAENRKRLPDGLAPPPPLRVEPDAITRDVLALVAERFAGHFGALEPFWFAVTREQALQALDRFVATALPEFGDYQDAMKQGEAWLFHSALSQYLNCGLLRPARSARPWSGRGATAGRRSAARKVSSARSWAGASTCGASIG